MGERDRVRSELRARQGREVPVEGIVSECHFINTGSPSVKTSKTHRQQIFIKKMQYLITNELQNV